MSVKTPENTKFVKDFMTWIKEPKVTGVDYKVTGIDAKGRVTAGRIHLPGRAFSIKYTATGWLSSDPLGCAEWLVSLRSEGHALFPFLPQPQPGAHGRWYEFRTYGLKQGLMAPTIEAWKDAMPAREKLSPLVGAFTALAWMVDRRTQAWRT